MRDGEHLSEMIRQAAFGEVPVSMARQERDADAAKEKEHRDRIREKAKKYGVKAVGVKFSDLESRVFAMMDARNKKAVAALDGRAQKRFEAAMSESQNALSDDEPDAVLADLLKMAEEARQERALDAEPTTEEPSWFADFPDESGNRSTGSGRESQPVDQAPSQPGLELAGQTADELAKQEAERVAAEKAQKADKAQAEADEKAATGRKAIKQASDAAASTFELGGDAMANLTGQVDMFATVATSKPAAAPIKPEGGPEDAAQDRPDGAHVFLKAPDGTVDFGEITPAMAESMKRQAGKIRLERGDDSYGEQHIELRHGKDIRGVGFKSVAEFVSEALQNISAIWKPSKTSQLVVVEAIEHGKVVFVELKPSDSGDYYTVNSAFPTPANYAEKKGKSAGWVKLWSGMALPPSAPAARTPSADRPSEKAGEGDATPSSKSSDSSVVNQTSESKPANTEDAATTRFQKGETRHNLSDDTRAFPVDRALYDMAQEGRTSAEILSFIGKASRRPFNRLLATHLARIGVSSTITLDSQGGWQFGNTSRAQRYAAAYNPRTDTVALFTPREAERHILHELVHAATLKAIASGGVSAIRMRRLFLHVQRSGRLSGQYGMSSLDEFVAEAFSNPRFQEALRSVPAPAGSTLKSAWQWFVRLVSRVLGLRTAGQETALDRALTAGAELMRENAALASGTEAVRFNSEARLAPNGNPSNLNEHQWQQVRTPEFKAWFGDWESAAKLEWLDTGKPIAMMSGDEVPVFPKLKLLAQWVGKYWADEHGGGVVNPDLGRIVLDETAASFSIGHGLSRSKANAFYLVPKVLENGVVLGQLPKVANKPDAYVIAAPVAIGEKTYRELVEVRIDQNMHRMYVHEVVLREESPDSAFNSSAASSSGKAEPQGARHGAIWNFMLSLRKVKASKAVDANGEPLASQVDQWEAEQSSGDLRYNLATDWYEAPRMAPVRNLVANALRSDKNTSWITPFNTQYHKAEKWAGEGKGRFKVVFNLVQRFLGDISKFAVMAQSAAPTLLHEWRTLSDVRETLAGGDLLGRQHRADVAAIASPLYEGTLYGGGNPMDGIKWSDDQLRARFKLSDRQIMLYHEALSAVKVSMDELAKSIISQHAKANSVNFDSDLPIGEMASGVIRRLEEARQDLDALLDPSEQERVDGEVADLREMDMNDEADRLKRDFARDRKNAALGVERIDKTIEDVQGIVVKNQALQDAGYFPLMRFGKHTVTAKDADGKVQFFGMYEGMPMIPRSGQYEANKVAAELRAAFPKWHVTTGIHNDQKHKLYQGMNIEAIQLFAEHMDQESLEPFQEFIRLATGNRSAQRRLLHRQGTPGFDKDVRRTLAQFMVSNARAASSNYHMQDMVRAAEDAGKDGGDIGAEAIDLVDYVRNPTEEAQALRGFLFFQFLGGSLASAVVNLTQTPAMTLPYLSQFEPAKPLISRLAVASKTAAVGKPERINDQKLREALIRAEQDGVTAPQEIHQLTATAANNVFAGSRVGSALLRGWGAPFAMAEGFNRRIAFIAAFQIAEKMGPDLFAKTGFHDSFAFAEDAVNQTQGIYNKGNRMNVGRGAAGSVLMTFKQYSIMYMELLKRLPPKQRAIMVGVLILAAGGGGLPGVEDAEDLWDTLGQWLGFASNSRRTIRNTLTEVIGRDAADLAINGALSRMGIDLHSRLGMQNLIPGTGILKQSSVDKARDVEEFFGPAASVIKSVGDALESLATGHPERAAMTLAPNAIRNAVQGAKMAAKGYSEDAKGRKGVPVNELEAAAKMIGFNPKDVADYGAVKRDLAQDQRLINVKREEFSSALADAMIANDLAARTEALQSMREWNEANPDMRVSIMPAAIFKRVRDARAEGVDRMLKSLPKGMRSKAMEEFASG